jgi:hypothetical protein
MNNRDTELIWEAYSSSNELKYGDIIPAIKILDSLNINIGKFSEMGGSILDEYIDPTGTVDNRHYGDDSNTALYDEKLEEFARQYGFYYSLAHNLFIPKCKKLADMALESIMTKRRGKMTPQENETNKQRRSKGYDVKMFPYIGIAATPESYRLLVREAWDNLPDCVIGDTDYDYSFHGGEGKVTSFIAAIGSSEQEVRSLLEQALKNVKAEYVGSSTEAKFRQRYQVREGD